MKSISLNFGKEIAGGNINSKNIISLYWQDVSLYHKDPCLKWGIKSLQSRD